MFQIDDPQGSVFCAGNQNIKPYVTRKLDRSQGVWTEFQATSIVAGSAVMYRRNVILKAGGTETEFDASNKVEQIDLSASNPQWELKADMHTAHQYGYLIALPDGHVLMVGGAATDKAEWYDPYSNTWAQLSASGIPRLHHSSALLMPDGSVFVGGGDGQPEPRNYQIFKPPYFFTTLNQRPAIANCPDVIYYGDSFDVDLVGATNVTAVRLIRSGAATHNFDQNQRCLELNFTVMDSDTIKVSSPATGFQAPHEYYMLFV